MKKVKGQHSLIFLKQILLWVGAKTGCKDKII
jgi:hypothetical protein